MPVPIEHPQAGAHFEGLLHREDGRVCCYVPNAYMAQLYPDDRNNVHRQRVQDWVSSREATDLQTEPSSAGSRH
jgi:hypothetical protein